MSVLSGITYGAYPYVNILSGVNKKTVRQSSHGFSFGTPIRLTVSGYTLASAQDSESAEVFGVVSNVISSNEFETTFLGEIFGDFSSTLISGIGSTLSAGTVYYLHPFQKGKYNTTASVQAGTVHKAVLIGTGASSGIVIPYTGGVISDNIVLSDSSSLTTPISQYNKFKIGDVVRFQSGSTSLTYGYTGGSIGNSYANGIYVLGQANTKAEAEVAGVVTRVFPYLVGGLQTGVNYRFSVLMDGFFDLTSLNGISVMNGSVAGNLTSGSVYYLNSDAVGTTNSLEVANKYSLTTNEPTVIGYVRKPMLFATSSYSGYVFSYRGDVFNGEQSDFTGYTGSDSFYAYLPL